MQLIFWAADDFCIICDCSNLFTNELKKTKSKEKILIKHLKHITFISICSLFYFAQSANTEFLLATLRQPNQNILVCKSNTFL